jgi:hypothetical protein
VARRVLQALRVQAYEEASALRQRKEYASIPAKLELLALISPKDPHVFYDLAAAYARAGNIRPRDGGARESDRARVFRPGADRRERGLRYTEKRRGVQKDRCGAEEELIGGRGAAAVSSPAR